MKGFHLRVDERCPESAILVQEKTTCMSSDYRIRSFEAYKEAYQQSITSPETFWADVASSFSWKKRWDKVLEWNFKTPEIKWFQGGKLNITENCLDRHLETFASRPAIIWVPNDPEEHHRVLTYKDLFDKVSQFGNVLKNNTYPLSVSAERLSQALHIAEHAKKLNADAVAHGSTGAGNDQVRFDMIFHIMIPGIEIITPIRDGKLSREEEIDYMKEKGVDIDFEKSMYSINKGLWGTSVGGKETLSSKGFLPEEA